MQKTIEKTLSLANVAALSAALDGDDGLAEKYQNALRGLRNAGAITADVSESGARGGYGETNAALARVLLVALQATGGRDMPMRLGRWLAERPMPDPATQRATVGVAWKPPTRGDMLVQAAQAGRSVTVICELVQPRTRAGLTWAFRETKPEPKTDLKRAARMVSEATRNAQHAVRATLTLPFSDLVRPVLDAMDAD